MDFRRRNLLSKNRLDIMPLTDGVFLLLVFLMLCTSFVLYPGLQIDPVDYVLLTIDQKNNVSINNKFAEKENLEQTLEQLKEKSVVIQAEGNVPLKAVVDVWDKCRRAGIQNVNIATRHENT